MSGKPSLMQSRWWILAPPLLGAAITLAVGEFADSGTAKAAGISTVAISVATVMFWSFRRERWFWPYIVAAAVLHAAIVCFAPWEDNPRLGRRDPFLLLLVVDIVLMLAAGYFTAKLTKSPSSLPRSS